MNTHKIKYVSAIAGYMLFLAFENGSLKIYDLTSKLENPIYAPLRDPNLFKNIKLDAGGYGVSWNDEIDLSEHECWENSQEIIKISKLLEEFS